MYAKLTCLYHAGETDKSPVLFAHGFPDSPAMFAAYTTEAERGQPWLAGRSIYTYAFPNRHDNPNFPPLKELAGGVMAREFDETLDALARQSPTGKLVILAHDWVYEQYNHWFPEQHSQVVLPEVRAFLK